MSKIVMNSMYGKLGERLMADTDMPNGYAATDFSSNVPEMLLAEERAKEKARQEFISMADPARIKKKLVTALNHLKTSVSDGKYVPQDEWDNVIDLADTHYEILQFRINEKGAEESEKALKEAAAKDIAELQAAQAKEDKAAESAAKAAAKAVAK